MTEQSSGCERPQPRRYLCLWLPFLPAHRRRREAGLSATPDEPPLAFVEATRGGLRLAALNESAAAVGLATGLALADARARVPHLVAAPADLQADARFLRRLAASCERFTPLFALDPPDGILLDVTGCAHLFGGEARLCEAVRQWFERVGLSVRASLAGTPEAARALARHGRLAIAPPGRDEACLRPLPVIALGLEPQLAVVLARAGLRTIADLADRPSVLLSARFGESLPRRLARTLGREDAGLASLRAAPDVWADRTFAEPATHQDALEAALADLVADACRRMEARAAGGRRFEAMFFRSDGIIRRFSIECGQPNRDAGTILRLFRARFESLGDPLDPGFGFDVLRLTVPVAERLDAHQLGLDRRSEAEANFAALLDRLSTRFGRERVLRFAARDTHDPGRETRRLPALDVSVQDPVSWREPASGEPPLRPLHLFEPPQPIEAVAEIPDGPPTRFLWRRAWRNVALAEGPERIAPEWWRGGERQARDYYRIEDAQGRRYWVFRGGFYDEDEGARWFLHGLFA